MLAIEIRKIFLISNSAYLIKVNPPNAVMLKKVANKINPKLAIMNTFLSILVLAVLNKNTIQ